MKENESGRRRTKPLGYVLIPEQLLDQLARISEPALRIVLYLHLAQFRAGMVGVPVALAELAQKSGFSEERARDALTQLTQAQWVEPVPGTQKWRLSPPLLMD